MREPDPLRECRPGGSCPDCNPRVRDQGPCTKCRHHMLTVSGRICESTGKVIHISAGYVCQRFARSEGGGNPFDGDWQRKYRLENERD